MLQIYSNLIAKKTLFANLPTFTFLVILFAMFALPTFAQKPVVGPLLQTQWGGSAYRMFTPVVDGEHTVLGCVAGATSQVMKYHNHPTRGTGQSEPYTTSTLGLAIPSVNFGETYYDWDNMLNSYTKENPGTEQQRIAVGTLMYHVAVSMKTNFNIGGSGQGGAPGPLTTFFGYDRDIESHSRRFYETDAEWEAIIKAQLDSGLPVIHSGKDSEGRSSHFFVVDGYDDAGRFHINMGYGGSRNGWYFLNDIKYGGMNHSYRQGMYINIKPDQGGTGTNKIALVNFVARNSIPQNEMFTANVVIRAVGFFSGGHVGTALVDNNGKIVEVIGVASTGQRGTGGTSGTININSYVPETVPPGQYNLRIVARPTGGDWEIVKMSAIRDGVPSSIPFTVTPYQGATPGGGYGMALTSFTTEKNVAIYGESTSFTINHRFRNVGMEQFPGGQAAVALIDNDGNIVTTLGTRSVTSLAAGSTGSTRGLACTVPATVEPGVYQLQTIIRPTGGEWRIATLSLPGIPNSIEFGVITKGSTGKVTFASSDGNGTLTASVDGANIASGTPLELGKKVIFKAVPNNTHYTMGWTVNGVAVRNNATDTLEITHFRDETIVAAIFEKKNFYHKIADYAKATENAVIVIDKNDTLNSLVNIPAPAKEGVTLTIKSINPAAPITLRRGKSGNLFTVSSGATLILENIIIHGSNDDDSYGEETGDEDDVGNFMGTLVIVNNGGSLVMNDGAVLRNNANLSHGGGVRLEGGTFTMNGGSIAYNTTDNRGGGVHINDGIFNMNGGEISGNTAATGGGVRINNATAVFTMQGGKISDNVATTGTGGVSVIGTFIMNGGEISNNTAGTTSGGISTGGTFTMNTGKIIGNTAGTDAGGVRVTDGTFTMNDGEISGNTANNDGGGIKVTGGTFTMQDGKIIGNTALDGGGMDVSGSSTTVTMNGGEISGNVATKIEGNTDAGRGGGMTVWSSAKFTMNGGKITGNTADVNAGGAYISGANTVFTMNGGEIIGNTAPTGNGINRASGTVNLNGGVVAGTGANITAVINGTHNLNKGEGTPSNAVIFAWNKPAGAGPHIYELGSSTNITVSAGATAVWATKDGKIGISYKNNDNEGFMETADVELIECDAFCQFTLQIASYPTASENVVVTVSEDFTFRSLIAIPVLTEVGRTLTIRSADPEAPVTLTRGITGNLFTVSNRATLILENIIIDGGKEGSFENGDGVLATISSGGTLVMKDGSVLRNNTNSAATGGVNVASGSTFIMDGGKIIGNTAGTEGGGVRMTGGTFTMNGGEISGNTATGADGGGVRMSGGTFIMQDGKISGNTALDGGGMDVSGSSTAFTMNGGEISGNTAIGISGNTDSGRGGGMTVWSSAKFTMNGGKINGNAADVSGGGVYMSGANTVFTMNGGEIIGNTAPVGNGILRASGTVNLSGGVVAGIGANITAVVNGTHNLNKGAIIAWNKPAGEGPHIYEQGTSTNLTVSAGATAVWENKDDKIGILYKNTDNEGFMEIVGITLITRDNIDIALAKAAIEKTNFGSVSQEVLNAQAEAKLHVESIISALELNDVNAVITDGIFTNASAGTVGNLNGTNGSYTFTVKLNKGAGTEQVTKTLTLAITATPYDNTQDNADIAQAKATIENLNFDSATMNTQEAAKSYVESIIVELELNGVAATVVDGVFTAAVAGTVSNTNGTNGSYTFAVKLNKGAGTEQVTKTLTLTITATPYDNTQDNTDIALAKETIESSDFGSVSQETLNTQEDAKLHVEKIIAELELNGVNATVADGVFTEANDSTDGSYTFTVKLNKGAGIEQVTETLTLRIIAAPYGTPTIPPQLAKITIQANSANKTIVLQNVPANAKVEVYNLQGKRIYSANHENPKILKIGVQTGVYIVKVGNQTLRVAVR